MSVAIQIENGILDLIFNGKHLSATHLVFSNSSNFSFLPCRRRFSTSIFIYPQNYLSQTGNIFYTSFSAAYRPSWGLFVSGPLKGKSSVAEHDTFTERIHLITWLKCSRNLTLRSTKITRPWNFWIFDLCQSARGVDRKIPLLCRPCCMYIMSVGRLYAR